jgi:hypothetical protein
MWLLEKPRCYPFPWQNADHVAHVTSQTGHSVLCLDDFEESHDK